MRRTPSGADGRRFKPDTRRIVNSGPLWTWSRVLAALVNGMLLIGSVALSLLVGEVALRALHLGDVRDHRLFTTYHPVLGWTKIPNNTGVHSAPEYRVTETINSEGIRGPECSRVKSPGERRILVLGDSFAEGYTVEFDELFSEVLKHRLNARANDKDYHYEVINTGTGGYSTDQELLLFQTLGKPIIQTLRYSWGSRVLSQSLRNSGSLSRFTILPSAKLGWSQRPCCASSAKGHRGWRSTHHLLCAHECSCLSR